MKKICLVLVIVLSLSMIVGCGAQQNQSKTNTATSWLDGKTKLIMATEAGFAPYEYYDDKNNVVGVDVDIAQAIADSLGLELEVIDMKFDTITLEVDAGRADIGAAGITITEDRAKMVDFSAPYATSKQIIVVKEGNADITGPDDLNGKTVGVQLGTVADFELEEWPDVKVAQYDKYFEAVSDLTNGRIDAIVMDILPAQEFISQQGGLVILDEELLTDEYAICVKKGNTDMLNAVNAALNELISSGKVNEFTVNHSK